VLDILWQLWYLKEATKALKHKNTQKNFISVSKESENRIADYKCCTTFKEPGPGLQVKAWIICFNHKI
jgi:hypothetical protein